MKVCLVLYIKNMVFLSRCPYLEEENTFGHIRWRSKVVYVFRDMKIDANYGNASIITVNYRTST
jgi:hypothetical protein